MNRKDADKILDIFEEVIKEVVVDVVGVSYDNDIPTLDCGLGGHLFEVQIGLAGVRLYRNNIPTKAIVRCLENSSNLPDIPIFIEFTKGETDERTKT